MTGRTLIPMDPNGDVIHNDPGAVVVRVYRVDDDGLALIDIGGALVAPRFVQCVADIQASLGGVLGAEIVKAIMREVYGHTGAPTPAAAPPAEPTETAPPPRDFIGDFLKELDNDGTRNPEPK